MLRPVSAPTPSKDQFRGTLDDLEKACALSKEENKDYAEHFVRLQERVSRWGLECGQAPSDGNCLFHSIGSQLNKKAAEVRAEVCQWIANNAYSYYLGTLSSMTLAQWLEQTEGGIEAFLNQMSSSGEWGDHVAVQAAAELYSANVCIISSTIDELDTCWRICIRPQSDNGTKEIYLGHILEYHYIPLCHPSNEATGAGTTSPTHREDGGDYLSRMLEVLGKTLDQKLPQLHVPSGTSSRGKAGEAAKQRRRKSAPKDPEYLHRLNFSYERLSEVCGRRAAAKDKRIAFFGTAGYGKSRMASWLACNTGKDGKTHCILPSKTLEASVTSLPMIIKYSDQPHFTVHAKKAKEKLLGTRKAEFSFSDISGDKLKQPLTPRIIQGRIEEERTSYEIRSACETLFEEIAGVAYHQDERKDLLNFKCIIIRGPFPWLQRNRVQLIDLPGYPDEDHGIIVQMLVAPFLRKADLIFLSPVEVTRTKPTATMMNNLDACLKFSTIPQIPKLVFVYNNKEPDCIIPNPSEPVLEERRKKFKAVISRSFNINLPEFGGCKEERPEITMISVPDPVSVVYNLCSQADVLAYYEKPRLTDSQEVYDTHVMVEKMLFDYEKIKEQDSVEEGLTHIFSLITQMKIIARTKQRPINKAIKNLHKLSKSRPRSTYDEALRWCKTGRGAFSDAEKIFRMIDQYQESEGEGEEDEEEEEIQIEEEEELEASSSAGYVIGKILKCSALSGGGMTSAKLSQLEEWIKKTFEVYFLFSNRRIVEANVLKPALHKARKIIKEWIQFLRYQVEEKKVKVQKWVLKEIIESSSEEISLLSSSLSAYCPTMTELLSNEFKVRLSDNIYRFFKTEGRACMVQVRDQAIRDKLNQRSIQGMASKLWKFLASSFWGDLGQFDLWVKYKTAAEELERFFKTIFQTMHAPETSNYTLAKELFVDILQYEKEYRDFIKSFKCLRNHKPKVGQFISADFPKKARYSAPRSKKLPSKKSDSCILQKYTPKCEVAYDHSLHSREIQATLDRKASRVMFSFHSSERKDEAKKRAANAVQVAVENNKSRIGIFPIFITSKLRCMKDGALFIPYLHYRDIHRDTKGNCVVFVVVEKHELPLYLELFPAPEWNVFFITVENHLGVGRSRTLAKIFSDFVLEAPSFWLLDDDVEYFYEWSRGLTMINDALPLVRTSAARALWFLQDVMFLECNPSIRDVAEILSSKIRMILRWLSEDETLAEEFIITLPDLLRQLPQRILRNTLTELDGNPHYLLLSNPKLYLDTLPEGSSLKLKLHDLLYSSDPNVAQVGMWNMDMKKCEIGNRDLLSIHPYGSHLVSLVRDQVVLCNAIALRELYMVNEAELYAVPLSESEVMRLKKIVKDQTKNRHKKQYWKKEKLTLAMTGYRFNDRFYIDEMVQHGLGGFQVYRFAFKPAQVPSIVEGKAKTVDVQKELKDFRLKKRKLSEMRFESVNESSAKTDDMEVEEGEEEDEDLEKEEEEEEVEEVQEKRKGKKRLL